MIDPNTQGNTQGTASPSGTALANALRTGSGYTGWNAQPLSQISQQMSQNAFLRSPQQQNPNGQY